jgi:hypothetical protein
MTAEQEKAKELIESFRNKCEISMFEAKECAMLHCDLNLKDLKFTHIGYGKLVIGGYQKAKIKYWQSVRNEIINYK